MALGKAHTSGRFFPTTSVLEVNTDSATSIEFTPRRRPVTLSRDQAYCQVSAYDPRPFEVYAGEVSMRTDNATFSVRAPPEDRVSVYLSEETVLRHESMAQQRER
jgi:ferric-dicitrate binding protein FerR (iron transport regulator)